ncbi:MAG: hypothetical protein M1840_001226 [Geoglossum simile]|nr:MAG: hypothetical protein M1840_001226 [Geoglossum simile]
MKSDEIAWKTLSDLGPHLTKLNRLLISIYEYFCGTSQFPAMGDFLEVTKQFGDVVVLCHQYGRSHPSEEMVPYERELARFQGEARYLKKVYDDYGLSDGGYVHNRTKVLAVEFSRWLESTLRMINQYLPAEECTHRDFASAFSPLSSN